MSEWDDSVFDEVAERMEAEEKKHLNCGKNGYVEAQQIDTIKNLKPYLCSVAVPHGHKGMPKARECKTCQSQCAYGRRLIELVDAQIKSAMQAKAANQAQKKVQDGLPIVIQVQEAVEVDDICTVLLTKSQCENVSEFIELHLLEAIRNDTDLDNVAWVKDMILAMETLKKMRGGGRQRLSTDKRTFSNAELAQALRCSATPGGACRLTDCPFWNTEDFPEDLKEELEGIIDPEDWGSCDVDAIALAAAERLEAMEVTHEQN